MMEHDYSLSPGFWEEFRQHHWGRMPAVLRQPLASPLMSGAEAFEAVQRACAAYRAGDRRAPIRLAVEDFLWIGADAGDLLPNDRDASVEAYAARMERRLEGRKFALVLESLQAHDARVWLRLREFLRPLSVSIPAHATNLCLFLGNYERTPYGIHRDPASIFMFVAHGRKRMRAWPPECFSDEDGPVRPTGAVPQNGIVLDGEPGDVLFWPSSHWHVGEGQGCLSIALSLGLTPARPAVDAWTLLMGRVEEQVAEVINADWARCNLDGMPENGDALERAARLAGETLIRAATDPALLRVLKKGWLEKATGLGCYLVPEPLPWRSLEDDEVLCVDPAFPIAWLLLPDHELLCSAGGRSFTIPADPRVQAMLGRLNAGAPATVAALVEEFAGTSEANGVRFNASPAGIRTILGRLYSFRAFGAPVSSPSPNGSSSRAMVGSGR